MAGRQDEGGKKKNGQKRNDEINRWALCAHELRATEAAAAALFQFAGGVTLTWVNMLACDCCKRKRSNVTSMHKNKIYKYNSESET